jgi:putative oxidoreductase
MERSLEKKLPWALLVLRVGIFIVMFVWALDKLVNPQHSAAVFSKFYGIDGLSEMLSYALGTLQLILCVAFLAGLWKTVTYGLIMLMHAGSTLSSMPQYIDAFNNLLFFAAWPMLAACIALFMLRGYDTRLSFK